MLKRLHVIAAALAASAFAAGCNGDDDEDSSLTASIAGSGSFTASTVQASHDNSILAFSGLNGDTQILVTIPNVTTTGTYDVGVGQAGVAQVVIGSGTPAVWTTALTGGTGQVVVTALDSEMASGSFTFTGAASSGGATGTKTVTSGSFTVFF